MTELTDELKKELTEEIEVLESQLSGNMMRDMDIRSKIHNIKMKLEGVRPPESFIECVGCGS